MLRFLILILFLPCLCFADIASIDGVSTDTLTRSDNVKLTILYENNSLKFSWTPVKEADLYRIYTSDTTKGYVFIPSNAVIEVPGDQASCEIPNASRYKGYYFVIQAVNQWGVSEMSAIVQYDSVRVRTLGDVPGADLPHACTDTYLNGGEADTNLSASTTSLNTYTFPVDEVANRIVMDWDLTNIPQDAVIKRATLSLYMHTYGGDAGYEITAHQIVNNQPVVSAVTWNTYNGTNAWTGGNNGGAQDMAPAESSNIVDQTTGYKQWDITKMVKKWVADPSVNFGVMLDSDSTAAADSHRYFRPTEYVDPAMRPKLVIEFLYNLNFYKE